jgi:hypothetical protein
MISSTNVAIVATLHFPLDDDGVQAPEPAASIRLHGPRSHLTGISAEDIDGSRIFGAVVLRVSVSAVLVVCTDHQKAL